jgi:hypothetical protein
MPTPSEPAAQHVVEQRVARVVVVALVAGEALLHEEPVQQLVERSDAGGQPVQLGQPGDRVQRRIGARGERQRGLVQRRVRLAGQLGEPGNRVHIAHRPPVSRRAAGRSGCGRIRPPS